MAGPPSYKKSYNPARLKANVRERWRNIWPLGTVIAPLRSRYSLASRYHRACALHRGLRVRRSWGYSFKTGASQASIVFVSASRR
jgi:hypothetical protein